MISAKSSVREIGATTVNFKNKDVCSWKLKPSESEIYFTRNYNITIENNYETDCYIIYGPSLDEMNQEIKCENRTSYTDIPSEYHVMVISIGTNYQAYFEFSYGTMQTDFWEQIAIVAIGSVVFLSCGIAYFI